MRPAPSALYHYEARHFLSPKLNLRRFQRFVTGMAIPVTLLLMVVIYIDPSGGLAGHYYPVGIVGIVLTCGVELFGLVTDFYYATLPIGKIQSEIATGHWDLVRVTTIDENALVITNYALTQQRAQRMVYLEQTLRYICAWLIFWNVLSHGYYQAIVMIAVIMTAVPFVLEPRWRMRTLTALGVALGVKLPDYPTSILIVFPVIAVSRLAALSVIYLAYELTAGLGDLGTLTMFVIIPVAGWLVLQIFERLRRFALSNLLHLNSQEMAATRLDPSTDVLLTYFHSVWEIDRDSEYQLGDIH